MVTTEAARIRDDAIRPSTKRQKKLLAKTTTIRSTATTPSLLLAAVAEKDTIAEDRAGAAVADNEVKKDSGVVEVLLKGKASLKCRRSGRFTVWRPHLHNILEEDANG
jgi:hypothetical protein